MRSLHPVQIEAMDLRRFGGGIDARWLVVSEKPAFFQATKRVHNYLHGFDGDGRGLNEAQRAILRAPSSVGAL